MPAGRLLIGPLLRRVVGTRATVWVETSAPAVVTVRAASGASGTAPTFYRASAGCRSKSPRASVTFRR